MTEGQRVVIFGAAGRLGAVLRSNLGGDFRLICADVRNDGPEPWLEVDVTDLAQVERAVEGADVVVHLAAILGEAEPEMIQRVNVAGTVNVLEAASRAGVRRVILASSNHVVGGYEVHSKQLPPRITITESDPVWPDSFYGAAKAHDEAVGRWYAGRDVDGLSVICLRIGTCGFDRDDPAMQNRRVRATWLSDGDFAQIVRCAIAATPRFGIYFAVSDNDEKFWSLERARAELGYLPVDRAENLHTPEQWSRFEYQLPAWVS